MNREIDPQGNHDKRWVALLCLAGLAVNLAGSRLALTLKLPVFLDSIGTMLAAALGGAIPGMAVGFLTNVINGISDYTTAFYGVLNVLIALAAAGLTRRGMFKRPGGMLVAVVTFALIGGGLGSVLTWLLYGTGFGEGISSGLAHRFYDGGIHSVLFAQLIADMLIDLLDKAVSVIVVALALRLVPEALRDRLYLRHWRQTPLTPEQRRRADGMPCRGLALRGKVMVLIGAVSIVVALAVTGISFVQFRESNLERQSRLARSMAGVAAGYIEADRLDAMLEGGPSDPGYADALLRMRELIDSAEDVQYVYTCRVRDGRCEAVIAPEGAEVPLPEDVVASLLPALERGDAVEPVVFDGVQGRQMTAFHPVRNSAGECVCYAVADISMKALAEGEYVFLARVVALFFGFFVLILAVSLWLAEYSITLPIDAMAMAAGAFAYDSEAARSDSLEAIRRLGIHTGDEIENLYTAMTHTTEETVRYIVDAQAKSETITQLQNGLIMVLADLVESRDKCTGDHVRKTAAYTRIILNQMREEGIYADKLTDGYINDVITSAPLHDVGKIRVSDTLLNKPGRLTDEEFVRMRDHTVDGGDIIDHAISTIANNDTDYLREASNMAHYHHEKWDGTGYPNGLKGEDIPLSARVMAVADVFDALVSTRSYKQGFPVDKALEIIRNGAGTHFDPNVTKAFLDAEEEVRRVAAKHEKNIFEDD